MDTLGALIRLARQPRGDRSKLITQEQLAVAVGTTKNTVSYWEQDKSSPRWADVEKVAEFCGVPMSWFIDDHASDPPQAAQVSSDGAVEGEAAS